MILQSVNTTKVTSVAMATFLTKGLLSATLNKKFLLIFFFNLAHYLLSPSKAVDKSIST